MLWTKEEFDVLLEHWGKGKTATQIGNMIGKSKRSVIGKAFRLKLNQQKPVFRARSFSIKIKVKEIPVIITCESVKSLLTLEKNECRWPIGDPVMGFCGKEKVDGKPYCLGHCKIAYRERNCHDIRKEITGRSRANAKKES